MRAATAKKLLLSVLLASSPVAAFASNATLADGKPFQFWNQSTRWTKIYYVDGKTGDDANPGTQAQPFKTIGKAASVLQPGEKVVIGEGIYRESVVPARGGTGPDRMIGYEAAPGANVIVAGSAIVDQWEASSGFASRTPDPKARIYQTRLDGALFGGYNPFGMMLVPQQKAFLVTFGNHAPGDTTFNRFTMPWLRTKLNLATYYRRRGMVFIDGKPLTQVDSFNELMAPAPPASAGTRPTNPSIVEEPQNHLFDEIGGDAGKVFIESDGMTLHVRLNGDDDPRSHQVEVTTKETVFRPADRGLGYIAVKGITFRHAGNGFPMPQIGLVSTNRGNHWVLEDNVFEWANSIGLDIGDETWDASKTGDGTGYDIIRGNTFRFHGIGGIAGSGTPNGIRGVLIEKNLFEWTGWQDAAGMSESGAIKTHYLIDSLIRGNVFRHIRHGNGIWLDVNGPNDRVTGNVFVDIPGEINPHALHVEASRGPLLVDHNIFASLTAGVLSRDSDHVLVADNLFIDTRVGFTMTTGLGAPRIVRSGTTANGFDNRILNNVFSRIGQSAVEFTTTNGNMTDGNVYGQMPELGNATFSQPAGYIRVLGMTDWDSQGGPQEWLNLETAREQHGWEKAGRLMSFDVRLDPETLQLTYPAISGRGVPVGGIDSDFAGAKAPSNHIGLYQSPEMKSVNVDPRK